MVLPAEIFFASVPRKLLPPRRRARPRGLEGAEEQGDDGRLPEKVPLVRELGDRLAAVADADINYLRRGWLGGGGVAGRRRSRLRDLQEHHGVEHAGGVGGAKRLLPKVRTLAGVLPFSAREGMRGRECSGEHDGDDGERPGHGVLGIRSALDSTEAAATRSSDAQPACLHRFHLGRTQSVRNSFNHLVGAGDKRRRIRARSL
jgi:hypothetical protein